MKISLILDWIGRRRRGLQVGAAAAERRRQGRGAAEREDEKERVAEFVAAAMVVGRKGEAMFGNGGEMGGFGEWN